MDPKRKGYWILGGLMLLAVVLYTVHPALGAITVAGAFIYTYAKGL